MPPIFMPLLYMSFGHLILMSISLPCNADKTWLKQCSLLTSHQSVLAKENDYLQALLRQVVHCLYNGKRRDILYERQVLPYNK